MKAVRLVRSGWWDDTVNGDAGRLLVLGDAAADEHVARGNAVYAPEHDPVQPEPSFVGVEAATARLNELTEAAKRDEAMQALVELTEEMGLYDEPVADQDALEAGHPVSVDPEMKRPYGNASKAAWIDWAVHQGAEAAEAAELTKNQLMARYGERL